MKNVTLGSTGIVTPQNGFGACAKKCPYGLDIPALLKLNYKDYQQVLAGTVNVGQ